MVYELFSEEVERRLFEHPGLFMPVERLAGHGDRVHDQQLHLALNGMTFPPVLFAVINAARDCGLDPEMLTPDYCL